MSRQLFVTISNSANTIQFGTVSPDYNSLLINGNLCLNLIIQTFLGKVKLQLKHVTAQSY